MRGQDFISVAAGQAQGKNAKMLELFIQYVLEHTGWTLDEVALYQKYDKERNETISWIERKPQVDDTHVHVHVEMGEDMRNRIQCLLCNEIIESKHRHDYVTCSCGNVSVDGGQDYCKVNFKTDQWKQILDEERKDDPTGKTE